MTCPKWDYLRVNDCNVLCFYYFVNQTTWLTFDDWEIWSIYFLALAYVSECHLFTWCFGGPNGPNPFLNVCIWLPNGHMGISFNLNKNFSSITKVINLKTYKNLLIATCIIEDIKYLWNSLKFEGENTSNIKIRDRIMVYHF